MRIVDAPSNDNAASTALAASRPPRAASEDVPVCPEPRSVVAHVLRGLEIGGAAQTTLDLATWQAAQGHGVMVVSLGDPLRAPMARDFRARGLPVHVVPKRPGWDATLTLRLSMLFARKRVDVVHTHDGLPLAYGALAGRLARALVVHTRHSDRHDDWGIRALRQGVARLVHGWAVGSERAESLALLRAEVHQDRVRCLPAGVDLERFAPDARARMEIRRQIGVASDAWVVGVVGRLARDTDTGLVLGAVAPLLREGDALVIVGQGPDNGALHRLADNLRVADRVRFVGARRDVPRWMAAFDVLCSTAISEEAPLVIPEAMATGLAVVAPAVSSVIDVFAGEGGVTVTPGDRDALRRALRDLRDDPGHSRRLGRRARQIARTRFSSERMAREYASFYRALVR